MRDWNTNKKGAVAELAIQLAAERLDIDVYKPVSEHGRTDLIFNIAGRLWRVQCKWGRLIANGAVVNVRTGGCRVTNRGYVRSTYTAEEIDLLAVYAGEVDRCFLLPPPVFAGRQEVQLRLIPTRNNQRACITLAADFEFEGAVAQLARASEWHSEGRGFESRQLHSPEPGSAEPTTVGSELFGQQVGYWMERASKGEEMVVTFRGRPRVRLIPINAPLLRAA